MASDKQIAANRRNALKSTGPRSAAGKKRSSANAYRHGLSVSLALSAESRPEIEALAKLITDGTGIPRADAEVIALWDLEQHRARRIMNATIMMAYLSHARNRRRQQDEAGSQQEDSLAVAQSVIDVLPELQKMGRYQRRALASRDRKLRSVIRERKTL